MDDFANGAACKMAFPGVNGGEEAENCPEEPANACIAPLQKPQAAPSNPALNWIHLLLVCGSVVRLWLDLIIKAFSNLSYPMIL